MADEAQQVNLKLISQRVIVAAAHHGAASTCGEEWVNTFRLLSPDWLSHHIMQGPHIAHAAAESADEGPCAPPPWWRQ